MNKLKAISAQQPLMFTLLLVITCICALYSTLLVNEWLLNFFGTDASDLVTSDVISSTFKNIISLSLVVLIVKFNWKEETLLTTPYRNWHRKWVLVSIPMILIAALNLTSIEWQILDVTLFRTMGWLYTNISTGIFEEVLLRGICFYVLYTAWKDQKNGLIKAAVWQAFIFGLAHYVNLTKAPFIEVSIQVAYSTLIGIGFAGLVAYTRSLWPAIAIHSLINAVGSTNAFFDPNFVQPQMSPASYVVVIVIIALICALPGYILLKKRIAHIADDQEIA